VLPEKGHKLAKDHLKSPEKTKKLSKEEGAGEGEGVKP
jgi:hypothetical protein